MWTIEIPAWSADTGTALSAPPCSATPSPMPTGIASPRSSPDGPAHEVAPETTTDDSSMRSTGSLAMADPGATSRLNSATGTPLGDGSTAGAAPASGSASSTTFKTPTSTGSCSTRRRSGRTSTPPVPEKGGCARGRSRPGVARSQSRWADDKAPRGRRRARQPGPAAPDAGSARRRDAGVGADGGAEARRGRRRHSLRLGPAPGVGGLGRRGGGDPAESVTVAEAALRPRVVRRAERGRALLRSSEAQPSAGDTLREDRPELPQLRAVGIDARPTPLIVHTT